MRYPVVIHKDPDSDFGVTVPDLPGCFSAGDTMDEAIEMAKEAISGHIETLLMEGLPVPELCSLQEHQADPDFADGIWALVDIDLSEINVEKVQVNITLPAPILAAADEAAAREGESRSGLFTRAVLDHISQQSIA